MTNVTKFPSKKQSKKGEDKEKRYAKSSCYNLFAECINIGRFDKVLPFPKKLMAIKTIEGIRLPAEILPTGEIRILRIEVLAQDIMKYAYDLTKETGDLDIDALPDILWSDALKMAEHWLNHRGTRLIESPKYHAFKSEPDLAYAKSDFDPIEEPLDLSNCPNFERLLQRTSNREALMAWIGSLFVESDRQQYVWIYGEGRNGKSCLGNFLVNILGASGCAETTPDSNQVRFWGSQLLGRRLAVFYDCNNYGFVTTGIFKSVSGGDLIKIERKYQEPFTAKIDTKFLFLSNRKPTISGDTADRRRIIYCHMGAVPAEEVDYDLPAKLMAERCEIISLCLQKYREMTKGGRVEIVMENPEVVEELISLNEDIFNAVFDSHFDAYEKPDDLPINQWPYLTQNEVSNILSEDKRIGNSNRDRSSFYRWMTRNHGIDLKSVKIPAKDCLGLTGSRVEKRFVLLGRKPASEGSVDCGGNGR